MISTLKIVDKNTGGFILGISLLGTGVFGTTVSLGVSQAISNLSTQEIK